MALVDGGFILIWLVFLIQDHTTCIHGHSVTVVVCGDRVVPAIHFKSSGFLFCVHMLLKFRS
jgi:hypothetical protein